jgi:hypothetical protein
MLSLLANKKVIVKRYTSSLGAYNRPVQELVDAGAFPCFTADTSSNTAQLHPQKKNTTELTLYTDPEAVIVKGDILYIYELDEYEHIIESTVFKAIADKPYRKRTHLAIPLLSEEEV